MLWSVTINQIKPLCHCFHRCYLSFSISFFVFNLPPYKEQLELVPAVLQSFYLSLFKTTLLIEGAVLNLHRIRTHVVGLSVGFLVTTENNTIKFIGLTLSHQSGVLSPVVIFIGRRWTGRLKVFLVHGIITDENQKQHGCHDQNCGAW